MYQGAIARFDPKTGDLRVYPIPKEMLNGATQLSKATGTASKVDGKVWTQNAGMVAIHRVDTKTGAYEVFDPFVGRPKSENHNLYDVLADAQNNAFFVDFAKEHVGRIDAKTGKIELFKTPTERSRPRRGNMDAQGRFWFGEFGAGRIGVFDYSKKEIREWKGPTPWSGLYDAMPAKNGEVWSGGQLNDRVWRLDPRSGQIIEYLLPRQTDIRHGFVDNTTNPPTFWVGNNRGASIVKVEPLQ
jgi:streptogramin lyase